MNNTNAGKATSPGWQENEICCLDVSLNNRYQVGVYLESTVDWINRRFASCIISLGDTLHRHNLAPVHGADSAYRLTREMGDCWLREARTALSRFTIEHKVIRSDEWLKMPGFDPLHEELWGYYYTHSPFHRIVEDDVEKFTARHQHLDENAARKASRAYLMEETAADILLSQSCRTTHLYPGAWHGCYLYLIENAANLPARLRGLENSSFKRFSPAKIKGAANANKKSDMDTDAA